MAEGVGVPRQKHSKHLGRLTSQRRVTEQQGFLSPKANARGGQGAQKETAARTSRNGGKETSSHEKRDHKAKGHARATLKLVPAWNDDGHLSGWISLGEALALAFANMGERR